MTTMKRTLGDLLKYEDNPNVTRKVLTVAAGAAHLLGTVLGRLRASGTVTVGAGVLGAGAAGNGTLTLNATPYTDEAREGTYVIAYKSATKADVINPLGENIGTATNGAEFSKEIVFTLAAGGNAFAAGDRWTVPVSISSNIGEMKPWNPAERDGTEEVAAVLLFDIDATDGAVETVGLVRGPSIVSRDALIFAEGTTTAQKADAFAALERLGIAVAETA